MSELKIRTILNGHRPISVAVLCLLVFCSILMGCTREEPWSNYVNNNFGYSIEYPEGWSISEPFQNRQMVVIKSADEKETISVLTNQNKGLSLDQQISYKTSSTRLGSYYYQIISDNKVKHQGIEAELLEVKYQGEQNSQRLSVMELYLVNKGVLYLVRFTTTSPDITPSIERYQRVFASFKLSGQ